MKVKIKYLLQNVMGFQTYLFVFALFVIAKLRWDKKEKDFFHFLKLLPEEGIILDIGANIGATSYYLSKSRPQSIVFSFEPLEVNMNILRRIKKMFKLENIIEFQMAVGDSNNMQEMVMPVVENVPMHGLSHVIHNEITELNSGIHYQVPMIRLDDFDHLHHLKERVSGIKIDVENFEYFALKGAENLIIKHKPIIYCELWDNHNRHKCIYYLNNLNYTAYVLENNKLLPLDDKMHYKHNFFFIYNKG